MRIAHLCPLVGTGGVGRVVRELAMRQAKLGHDVYVASTGKPAPIWGVHGYYPKCWEPMGKYSYAPRMERWVRKGEFDIVHGHSIHGFPALHGYRAAVKAGVPFVLSPYYHGQSTGVVGNLQLGVYRRTVGKWMVRGADAVIASSKYEAIVDEEDFGRVPTIIRPGVGEPRERLGMTNRVLCVGRVEKYKRFQDVVRAMEFLPDHHLIIVGEGSYEDRLMELAVTLGVRDRVDIVHEASEEELNMLYASSKCLVALSTLESFGLVVAEALNCGCPAIVGYCAMSEFSDGGLCRFGGGMSSEGLADMIRESRVRAYTKKLSSWDEYAGKVGRVYEGVLPQAG